MVIQENAFYKNELWCVYELKDAQGNYDEETRLKMRKASQNNEFVCPDCGEHLVLCAGNKVEPYFRHHENANCPVRTNGQGTRYLLARRLLFQVAKRSFPHAAITCSRQGGKYVSDIFIEDGDLKMVRDVEENLKSKKRTFLNDANSGIFDKKPNRDLSEEQEIVQKAVQRVEESLAANRENKRLHMEAVKEREIKRDGGKNFKMDGTPKQGTLDDKLHRHILTTDDGPLTARMTAIGESWDLPQLKGNEAMLPKANSNRKSYLESLNNRLQNTPDRKKQELFITKAVEKINSELKIYAWHCYKRS